jgi:MoaA/NifB/PqqE/SkfB family radical SAM enzyme
MNIKMKKDLKQEQKEKAATKGKHWVRLTKVCNNNCLFCLDKDAQNGTMISITEIKEKLLDGRKKEISQVVLSGGEATVHPDFLEIIKMAKDAGYQYIQVITNGRMFAYRNFLESAVKAGLDEVTFSMHGHNEKLHDTLTQINGSFQQAISGLMNALSVEGLIVNIDVVINKQNYKHLADIIKYFFDLGVREFDLLQIIPSGRAWENKDDLFYDIPEALPYIRRALVFSRNPDVFIWTNRFPPAYLEGFEDLIQHPAKLHDEIRGRQDMFKKLLNRGEMMKCHGKRCQYCFLNNFCQDLIEFIKKGELDSKKIPHCLEKTLKIDKSKGLSKNKNVDIFAFLEFFIDQRYFLKGQKCALCKFIGQCDGMQINYIRKFGFGALKPIPTLSKDFYLTLSGAIRCELNCVFCSTSLSDYRGNGQSFPDMDFIKSSLKDARRYSKSDYLYIGGNEPLWFPDITDIIKYAEKLGFKKISIASTGLRLANKSFVDEIVGAGVDRIELPIYGHNEKLHDSITGTKGSFAKIVKAMNNLRKHPGVRVVLHTLMLKQNYLKIPELYDFVVKDMRGKEIEYRKVRPRAKDPKDYSMICPSFTQIKKVLEKSASMPHAEFKMPLCALPKFYLKNLFLKIQKESDKGVRARVSTSPSLKNKVGKIEKAGMEISNYASNYSNFGKIEIEEPVKLRKCNRCKLSRFCGGIPQFYTDIYGDSEFEPFQSIPKEIDI